MAAAWEEAPPAISGYSGGTMVLKNLPQLVQQKLIRGIIKMPVSDKDLGLCSWDVFSFSGFAAWKSMGNPSRGLDSVQGIISALCCFLFCFLP